MLFDVVGGEKFFVDLVDRFYDGVETDQVLIPLYPEGSDTIGARRRLALFLMQYFGGPDTYMQERGHPRLRMRHFPYQIGEKERDHWLLHMVGAIEDTIAQLSETAGLSEEVQSALRNELVEYVVNAAEHLRNQ
jgi:hemoglobin